MNSSIGLIVMLCGFALTIRFMYIVADALNMGGEFWLYLIGVLLVGLGSNLIKD